MPKVFVCSCCRRLGQIVYVVIQCLINFASKDYCCNLETSYLRREMNSYLMLLFLLVQYVKSNNTSNCGQKEITFSYLNVAVEMIDKAKSNMPTCSDAKINFTWRPVDCADIMSMGHIESGVYTIWPINRLTEDRSLKVYCDMNTDGGGWTLIQRRGYYGRPVDFFFKDWQSYKEGFGDIQKDFWLGNDNIFALTNQKSYSARFDLQDVKFDKKYAQYDYFWIDDESNKYTLHIADFSGDAGDSMTEKHNNQKFTTKDADNDNHKDKNCALLFKGGWWYNACHHSNLNGLYMRGVHNNTAEGVNWYPWKGHSESLEATEIKIRPKIFIAPKIFTITPQ